MKKKMISPRDFERLSAYLDGQLPKKDAGHLEARLKVDLELKAALDDLRRTRHLIRRAPKLPVPRNFTLKPEMIPQPKRWSLRLYPAFGLASAITSILFVLIVIGDFWISGVGKQLPVNDLAAPEMMMVEEKEMAAVEEASAEMAQAPPTEEAPAPEAMTLDAEVTQLKDAPTFAESLPEASLAAGADGLMAEDEIAPRALGAETEKSAETTGEAVVLEAAPPYSENAEPQAEVPLEKVFVDEIPETEETDSAPATLAEAEIVETMSQEIEPAESSYPNRFRLIRGVEILLGLAAIGSGLTAYLLRRRG